MPSVVEPALTEPAPFIDWTFFFTAWELKGRYPKILDHPKHGAAARELFDNGNELLDEIIADGCCRHAASTGSGPRNAEGDDIVLANGMVFPMLRQQVDTATTTIGRTDGSPTTSLRAESGLADHLGAFAVTAGLGADELVKTLRGRARRLPRDHGEGARRPARRGVRRMAPPQARIAWYAQDEPLPDDGARPREYRGIRPAFGYPACPDHSQKRSCSTCWGRARSAWT